MDGMGVLRFLQGRPASGVPAFTLTAGDRLEDRIGACIVRDIDEAAARDALGMEMDRVEWVRVREAFATGQGLKAFLLPHGETLSPWEVPS